MNSNITLKLKRAVRITQLHYYYNYGLVPDDQRDLDAMNLTLRTFGTGYDIESLEKFYDKHGKSVPAKMIGTTPTEGMKDITLNGKPSKLYAEVQGNLVMKDGMVTTGTKTHSSGDMISAFPSDLPAEPGTVGHIHTHPVAVVTILGYRRGNLHLGGRFPDPGPSPEDNKHARDNKTGVWNVVVDSKNVYLTNGTKEIKISRKQ